MMKKVLIHESLADKITAKQVVQQGEGVYASWGLKYKIEVDDFYNLNCGPIVDDGALADGAYLVYDEGEDF